MKSLIRWTAILSLFSMSWLECPPLKSQWAQALPAKNTVLVSQMTTRDYLVQAISRVQVGDWQEALKNANKAIQLSPKFAPAYGIRANAHIGLGNFQQALADANQAIQLNPKLAPAYGDRAIAHAGLGDFQQALADASQAIKLDPKSAPAYGIRANAHNGLRDFQQALADANQAIQLNPKFAFAYGVRANAHAGLNNFQQAFADANQAIQLDPKAASAYAIRARARIGLGNIEEGLADAKQAIQINPKDGDGYYAQGLARLKQGDQQGAIADYNQAIQKEPSLAKELENYTKVAQSQGQDTKAAVNPSSSSPPSSEVQRTQNSGQSTARRTSTPVQATPSAQDVYTTASQTTVLIDGQNPGSGVIIARTNNIYYVLTAKHVVATPDEYKIVVAGGKVYDIDPNKIKRLPKIDLAIVEFASTQNYPVAPLGDSDQVKQGANVYVSGWPLPDQAITKPTQIVTEGQVVGLQTGDQDGYGLLYGNNTAPGMSGGPVLDTNGQVIGIHGRAAGNQESGKVGINLGIPINLFLQSASPAGINLQQLGLKAQN